MADPIDVTDQDLDIAARTLDGEARGEPLEGQQGVAWVMRTRTTWSPPAWWGHTLSQVCTKPFQFSCWLGGPDTDHINALNPADAEYQAMLTVIKSVMNGEIDDPTGGATHYEVIGTGPKWVIGRTPSAVIGHHAFYRIGP